MKIQLRQHESGIALIIVLIVIVVLGIMAGGFAYSMKVETTLARNSSHDAELEWLGRSGVELARYILAHSSPAIGAQFDALNQKWAGGPGDTNDPLADIPMKDYKLGKGSFSIEIKDMDRKFNINVADPSLLRQALQLVGVDAADVPTIADSIIDWRDPQDNPGLGGSKEYYRSLTPPYDVKNGPLDDLSELLLIRGITPAMYWGSAGGGAHAPIIRRPVGLSGRRGFDEPTYAVGLVDVFTALSSRMVNVNTASATALQIFPEIDENIAQAITTGPTGRAGPDGADGTIDDTPFRSVAELARVPGLNAIQPQQLSRYFTVRSLVFEARVDVQIDKLKRQYVALLRRNNPRDIQVLNLYWR